MFKNNYLRKAFIVQIVFVFLCVSAYPKRADAFAPAVPIAAVGSFALGVAAAAIIAHELGYEAFSDDAWTYSDALWALATETVKVSVKASYDAAVAAGHKYMTLSQPTLDWIKINVLGIAVAQIPSEAIMTSQYIGAVREDWNNKFTNYTYSVNTYETIWVRTVNPLGPSYIYLNGYNNHDGSMFSAVARTSTGIDDILLIQGGLGTATYTVDQIFNKIVASQNGKFKVMARSDYEALQAKAAALAASSAIPTSIALPGVGDIVAHPRNDRTKTAVQNPDTGAWSIPGGAVIPESDLAFEYPKPTIATDGTLSVPIGGVAVDATTGEAVGTGTANPPLDWSDTPSDSLNFGPLRIVGNLFTTKFPFSIPWDIERQFNIFNVTPKAPILHVDKTIPIFNTSMKLKFNIDFTIMEPAAIVVRWFMIIAFDLGMILSMRKFMPE